MVNTPWLNNDGLYLKYGPAKTVPTSGGDYLSYGETREMEFTLDLNTLTAAVPLIINDITFIGASMFIEQVEVDTEIGAVGGTTLSVGTIGMDRTSTPVNTAFVNALAIASFTTAGQKVVLTTGVTGAGTAIGTVVLGPLYITATAAGTFTAGRVKVRIKYRGIGTITQ